MRVSWLLVLLSCATSAPDVDAGDVVDAGGADSGETFDAGPTPIPLKGCGFGFTAQVTLGDQTFRMLLDTGSSTVGIAAASCSTCGVLSPLYKTDAGAVDRGRRVTAKYASVPPTGWSGEAWQESVSFGGVPFAVPVDLVAIDTQSSFFDREFCSSNAYQGIFGLGLAAASFAGTTDYLDVLADAGAADVFSFALCDGTGTLWLGGSPPVDGGVRYVPMVPGTRFYTVTATDGFVGDAGLGLQPSDWGNAFIDTGGSALWLPQAAFDAVVAAIGQSPLFQSKFGDPVTYFSSSISTCWQTHLSDDQVNAALPTLSLVFGDVRIESPATRSYLRAQAPGCYLPALYAMPSGRGSLPPIELGATFLRGKTFVIDRANGQVGFGAATCL